MCVGALDESQPPNLTPQNRALGRQWLVPSVEIGCGLLKWYFGHPRPIWCSEHVTMRAASHEFSFPSSHSMMSFALAVDNFRLVLGFYPAHALALSIAVSRVYEGVHWPHDILAGSALGLLTGHFLRALLALPAVEATISESVPASPWLAALVGCGASLLTLVVVDAAYRSVRSRGVPAEDVIMWNVIVNKNQAKAAKPPPRRIESAVGLSDMDEPGAGVGDGGGSGSGAGTRERVDSVGRVRCPFLLLARHNTRRPATRHATHGTDIHILILFQLSVCSTIPNPLSLCVGVYLSHSLVCPCM